MSIALIDFSSLFHRLWHVNREEVEFKIQNFLTSLPSFDDVIICIDSPPYKRKEIDSKYKANRDVPDPELTGTLRACIKKVSESGYTMAHCDGWEADDVIATMVARNTEESITVYGTDKDLLQCTDLIVPFTNEIKTPESTLGVAREKVIDYLCLCGDTSDNVKGVNGIGPATAVKILDKFGSLAGIYEALKNAPSKFTDKTAENLLESLSWIDTTLQLITLNSGLDIVIEKQEHKIEEPVFDVDPEEQTPTVVNVEATQSENKPVQNTSIQKATEPQYIVKTETVDYRHALEPMGIEQAWKAAVFLHKSGLYQQFKGPEQTMAVIMRGRALGIDATTALDQMNMIQGRPTLSAQAMIAIVKASPKCKYFHLAESSEDQCTWETWRDGDPGPTRKILTRKECDDAGFSLQPEYVWDGSKKRKTGKIVTKDKWVEIPATMIMWRCGAALARPVYPDLLNGIYATEEME